MSRQMSQRNLTLTEELEKLEQSITLTLQEIDSNFSKAHRIVTTSILPIVEQYAKHSNDVWEGSKFWKQFFEASANVSLSGYEENANEEEDVTHTDTTSTNLETPTDHGDYGQNGGAAQQQQQQKDGDDDDDDEEFTVDSPTQVTGLQTTPKLPSTTKKKTTANGKGAAFRSPSPRKYTGKNPLAIDPSSHEGEEPSTPRPQTEGATNPQSSPFEPESAYQPSALQSRTATNNNNDPLMHRVLDKNYRIQATPHTQRRQRQQQQQQQQAQPSAAKPTPATKTQTHTLPWDDSPQSSPVLAAPQLRSDLFSPARPAYPTGPRTPGISVLTPARGGEKANGTANGANPTYAAAPTTSTGRQLFSPQDKATTAQRARTAHSIFSSPDSRDEDDEGMGIDDMSPPKTLQFHVPNSRLMQTPAREASKKIVEDLLLTAGADATDDIEGIDDPSLVDEPSPSLVRNRWGVDVEDSF